MIIAGGTYAESCRFPHWDRIFGSGLRAALAVSTISPGTILHSYVHEGWRDDVVATLAAFGVAPNLVLAADGITFQYLHSFEKLGWTPIEIRQEPPLDVQGDVVLRFGMLEGEACVAGERVIYDPQSDNPGSFSANGSTAKELALVLNRAELLQCGLPDGWMKSQDLRDFNEFDDQAAVQNIRDVEHNRNALLVVKRPLGGAVVYVGDDSPVVVPGYAANGFFRIGSGDIFSAAFGYAWGELRMAPAAAADYASRCLGYFVEDHRLPLPAPRRSSGRLPVPRVG
ncbi:MAG: hypothetical protein HC869_27030, partial [Rhodospirillales bacterium]|nr:hypothetical protein [Rhodospirillales bacterium]